MRCFLFHYTLLFLSLTGALAWGQVAPPNFRALPGVGSFSANQVGRWDATARKFVGGPLLASGTTMATTTPYTGAAIDYRAGLSPLASYAGGHLAELYVRGVAPSDAFYEAIRGDAYRSTGNPFLTGVRGDAVYDGAGSPANLIALNGDTECLSGTPAAAKMMTGTLGVQGACTLGFGAGYSTVLFTQGSSPSITDANLFFGAASLPAGHISSIRGLALRTWVGGGTVDNSDGIYADSSIDIGTTHHFINSSSTSASLFAGDVAYTSSSRGPVLKAPNGHYFRLAVDNTGALSTADLGTSTP